MTGTILTSKGLRLITKVLASGLPLAFSRVAVGTGTFPEGYNPFYAIGLNRYKMDGDISGTYSNGEEATIIFQIGAQPIEESFIITEVGLFAQDPDEGEVLYAYLNLSNSPEYVYATNGTVQKLVEIEFKTIIGEVEHVSVITSPNALITKEEFQKELQKKISSDGGDISETIAQFEDYTGEDSTPPDARTAIANIKSKTRLKAILSNVKAALMGLVTIGEMRGLLVNHGLCTEPGKFFLDAAYGKYLTDQITQLNSDFSTTKAISLTPNPDWIKSDAGKVLCFKIADRYIFQFTEVIFLKDGHVDFADTVLWTLGENTSSGHVFVLRPISDKTDNYFHTVRLYCYNDKIYGHYSNIYKDIEYFGLLVI